MAKKLSELTDCPAIDYFMNEDMSDVVFVVEGQRLPAIKLILCMNNKVFRAMFSHKFEDFKESKEKTVVIEETTFEAFKTLILFLYSDRLVLEVNDDFKLIEEVCELSDRYDSPRLLEKVGRHLMSIALDLSNFNAITDIAFNHKINDLLAKTMQFMANNFNDIVVGEDKSDVVFMIEGQRVPAIIHILCMRNAVFRAMFSDNSKESKDKTVVIEDTSFEAFKTLILFLYSDRLVLKDDKNLKLIKDICELSDRYDSPRLLEKVGQHLMEMPLNCSNITAFAVITDIAFKHKIEELMAKVMSFIDNNFDFFVKKDIKQLSELNDSTNDKLLELIVNNYKKIGKELRESKQSYKILERGKCETCKIINLEFERDYTRDGYSYTYTCKVCKNEITYEF